MCVLQRFIPCMPSLWGKNKILPQISGSKQPVLQTLNSIWETSILTVGCRRWGNRFVYERTRRHFRLAYGAHNSAPRPTEECMRGCALRTTILAFPRPFRPSSRPPCLFDTREQCRRAAQVETRARTPREDARLSRMNRCQILHPRAAFRKPSSNTRRVEDDRPSPRE